MELKNGYLIEMYPSRLILFDWNDDGGVHVDYNNDHDEDEDDDVGALLAFRAYRLKRVKQL